MANPLRVLLTGAAGKIGGRMRDYLSHRCALRSLDINELSPAQGTEEVICADLADMSAVQLAVGGVDAIVHMAGIPREAPIEQIATANLIATYNVFAAARDAKVGRIVLGSTNHVVGFYRSGEQLDANVLPRPDTLYGASKVFGEAIARLFWDKHGIEAACVRIGSALDRPSEPRHLSTWISYSDLNALVWECLTAPRLGFTVMYGMSANSRAWWSNRAAGHVGFAPRDSADHYTHEVLEHAKASRLGAHRSDPALEFQGGPWAAAGYTNRSQQTINDETRK